MWYRYCRLIIAGKEHIIKKIIDYFAEKGIGQIDLQSLQHNLNTLDKNNLLPPIIELRQKDGVYIGVFFGDTLYEDFLKFREKVDGLYGEYKFRQKTKEQKKLQENEIEFVPGKISVYPCNSVYDTIKYGVGTSWCISQPGSGMYDLYRNQNVSTFYYVQDNTRQSYDPLSRVMVDIQANGVVELTDINNTTGTIAEFGEDWEKYFEYLEKNGVDISQFVNKPMTQEEIEENNLIGKKINDLKIFERLPLEYKFKYIVRGHLLTTEQLIYILKLNTYSKNTLIKAYLNTGRFLPKDQKLILLAGNEVWRTTYIRKREIVIDQIEKHFKDDYEGLEDYAYDLQDVELINTRHLYEDPLKSTDIVVKNIEEFNILLKNGVSLEQFKWSSVSQIPNLSEDFIREFADYVDWNKISEKQTLSEDFIREFQDKVEWYRISTYQKLSEDFIREFKDKVNWNNILRNQRLSEDFIREFQDKMKNLWHIISSNQTLSEDFIREFQDKVEWYEISWKQKLSEDFIKEFQDKVNWDRISQNQTLSGDFIREFQDNMKWWDIFKYQKLSEDFIRDFIREFQDKVNWAEISQYQTLSEDFIRDFKDKVSWWYISEHQKLSEDFIKEFQNKMDWNIISAYQTLSENFIRKFQGKVNWDYISRYQRLSEDFIREFQDKVNWGKISQYQTLSEDFIREFQGEVDWYYISRNYKIPEETKYNLRAQGFPIEIQ